MRAAVILDGSTKLAGMLWGHDSIGIARTASLRAMMVIALFAGVAVASANTFSNRACAPAQANQADAPVGTDEAGDRGIQPQPTSGPSNGAELRAVALAEGMTQLSGVAVSPLFGLSLIGVIDYFRWDPARGPRPTHANPWIWGSALAVMVLSIIAGSITFALPWPGNLIVGAIRNLEAHVAGLVAAGILIPTLSSTLTAAGVSLSDAQQFTGSGAGQLQAGFLGWLGESALTLALFAMYMAIRVVSLVFDALIMISPFVLVDSILRSIRTAFVAIGFVLLQGIMAVPTVGPWLVLAALAVFLFLCFRISGWCVRFNLFATSCAWDILTLRWWRVRPQAGPLRAFVATGEFGPAVRTRGTVHIGRDAVEFRWKPWFILRERSVQVDLNGSAFIRGIAYSSIVKDHDERERSELLLLPPRYLTHHEALADRMQIDVGDGAIRRGIRAAVNFIRNMFRRRPKPKPSAA